MVLVRGLVCEDGKKLNPLSPISQVRLEDISPILAIRAKSDELEKLSNHLLDCLTVVPLKYSTIN